MGPPLLRQIRTNQVRGFDKLLGGSSNPLSALSISAWIVCRAPSTSGAIECCKLRRAYAPIAPLLSGHDMKVEVGCFLPTKDAVVLERKYSKRLIGLDKRLCDPLGRNHNGLAFLMREIEQRSDMPACDNATLANFELPGVYHRKRMLALIYDRPSFFAACHSFAKVAWISYGKLNQLSSPIRYKT